MSDGVYYPSKKAAREMRDRIVDLLKDAGYANVTTVRGAHSPTLDVRLPRRGGETCFEIEINT
jgi:hypothetical protein